MNDKELVAHEALKYLKNNSIVGLGTGSTANLFIEALAQKIQKESLTIKVVASSTVSQIKALECGLDYISLDQIETIDTYVDGADEVTKNLEVLNSICSLMDIFPEREECIDLYNIIEKLLDNLNNTRLWPFLYIKFELLFIERMGYGLDLSSCAVNGSTDNLNWVSPKTGRAVSALGAKGWEDRLLKLPEFLGQNEIKSVSKADLLDSLKLTEFFLIKRVYSQYAKNLSSSRKRMFDYLSDDSFII